MKKLRVILIIFSLFLITSAVYFAPKPLRSVIVAGDIDTDAPAYCTVYDVSARTSQNISAPSGELLAPLLDGVLVSGPVPYQGVAVNAEMTNLYFALPRQGEDHRRVTAELVLSNGEDGAYDVFINVGGRGYTVVSGEEVVADFIREKR